MENNENIKIKDDAGDKKYFTVIPNFLTDILSGMELALYVQMKKYSGEKGIAYPSKITLTKRLDITKPTLNKYLDQLIAKGLISENGFVDVMTSGGKQQVQSYFVLDVWGMNLEYYNTHIKGVKKIYPLSKGGKNTAVKGVKNTAAKSNHLIKSNSIAETSSALPFSLIEERKKLEDSERRDLNIIALFMEYRVKSLTQNIKSRLQLTYFIKRHVRAAGQLAKAEYTDEQLTHAFDAVAVKYKDIDWTLETVGKELTK